MIFSILLKTGRNEVLPYLSPATSPTPFLVVEPPCVSLPRGGLPNRLAQEEWAQELREVRKKFADEVASEMSDVKKDLAHVRELLGVLVRRERCAENKAEIAARRLDRVERQQHEADDAEHEANLQEVLANQSKAVQVLVDQ